MSSEAALAELLQFLRQNQYRFTAISPASHRIVVERSSTRSPDLRDIFGWNRPFTREDIDPRLLEVLLAGDAVEGVIGDQLKSRYRVASLGDDLFLHSSFPTDGVDSVFFGPDTYRFVRFVQQQALSLPSPNRVVDMGTGSGAGGIAAARLWAEAEVCLVDVNGAALRMAAINADFARVKVELFLSDAIPLTSDLIIANPPYLLDVSDRTYRNGGGLLGEGIALEWVRQALEHLQPAGTMLLYTGAAYEDGRAQLASALEDLCSSAGAELSIEEIDPDVFGEELSVAAYRSVERIAALGIRMTSRR